MATASSLSWARWRSRQIDSTVAQHRHQQPHVLAVRVGGQRVDGLPRGARAGRARPPAGRRCARRPRRRRRPRRARRAAPSSARGCEVGGRPSCSIAVRAPRRRSGRVSWAAQVRLALEQAGGAHQGEQPRRLVPAGGRDVALGVEGGDGRGGRRRAAECWLTRPCCRIGATAGRATARPLGTVGRTRQRQAAARPRIGRRSEFGPTTGRGGSAGRSPAIGRA